MLYPEGSREIYKKKFLTATACYFKIRMKVLLDFIHMMNDGSNVYIK